MEKRYQVFVSSTFNDLKDERQRVMQTLMKMDCIPAGMELFPAADEEQWAFIQKVIDDCDYYLLIIGGRYGSVTAKGISYTEKEHDYAVRKGIPVIALLHKEPDQISVGKSEVSDEPRRKLAAFREKVSKGRLVNFWLSADELASQVALSLIHAFKAHPKPGWVRGGTVSNTALLQQLNELRQRNDALRKRASQAPQVAPPVTLTIAEPDATFDMHGWAATDRGGRTPWIATLSWNQITGVLGPRLLSPVQDANVNKILAAAVRSFSKHSTGRDDVLDATDFDTVKIQLLALGHIDIVKNTWVLTAKGREVMFNQRAVKGPHQVRTGEGATEVEVEAEP